MNQAMKSAPGSISPVEAPKRAPSSLRGIVQQTFKRARENELSVTRQMVEMVILRLFYGLGPGFYHIARFWRKDLPWSFKTGFWPYRKFSRFVSAVNPPSFQKLSQHKVCEKAILQLLGIPTPRFVGSLHRQRGRSPSGESLTSPDQLYDLLLRDASLCRLCFKLVEGYGGFGFQAVEIIRNGDVKLRMLDSDQAMSVSEFLTGALALDKGAEYIIEEYIEQHPELAKLNPSSVNTIRVWAACIDGQTSAIDAFLRVGGRGALVDNTSRGAHIFRLDMQTGKIGEGMIKNIQNDTYQCHRDSGERITGGTLPFWQDALELAGQAVAAFPRMSLAGVDVAFTVNGPVVIELNVEPDPTSALIFDRSHRELLARLKHKVE
jgi:hypothetical protein